MRIRLKDRLNIFPFLLCTILRFRKKESTDKSCVRNESEMERKKTMKSRMIKRSEM